MVFDIDLPTVLLLNTTGLTVGALVLQHVRQQMQQPNGLGSLALGFGCLAVGSAIASLTDHLPEADQLWPHLSLLLGTLGYSLLAVGFHALSANKAWRWSHQLLGVPFAVALLGWVTGFPLINEIRATVFHGFATAALVWAAFAVLRHKREEYLPTRPLLACSLLLSAGFYVLNLYNLHQDSDTARRVASAFFFGIICNFSNCLLTIAMVNDRTQRRLRQIADTDPLTGIGNRRNFMAHLPSDPPRYAAIVLIDLDHFKRINDDFGHATGDAVLVASAQCLTATLPTDAVFARFGGEEFVLYLPAMERDHALATAERLRRDLEHMECVHAGRRVAVTASMGVAMAKESGNNWQALLQQADQALYAAKTAGRNRVVAYSDAQDPGA